jgi:hypothetical protein
MEMRATHRHDWQTHTSVNKHLTRARDSLRRAA